MVVLSKPKAFTELLKLEPVVVVSSGENLEVARSCGSPAREVMNASITRLSISRDISDEIVFISVGISSNW